MTVQELITNLTHLPDDIKQKEIFSMQIPSGTWNYSVEKIDDKVKFIAYTKTGEITNNRFNLHANLKL